MHEVHQDLVLLDATLPDHLHCALNICFDVLGEEDLPERALPKDFEELIVCMDVANLLVALEILEIKKSPVLFLQLLGVSDGKVGVLVLLLRGPHIPPLAGPAERDFNLTSAGPILPAACFNQVSHLFIHRLSQIMITHHPLHPSGRLAACRFSQGSQRGRGGHFLCLLRYLYPKLPAPPS